MQDLDIVNMVSLPQIDSFSTHLKRNSIGFAIGAILLIWGIYQIGIFRIIVGMIFIFSAYNSAWREREIEKQTKAWIKYHNNRYILMYAGKKGVQNHFREKVFPLLKIQFEEVYYDGPKFIRTFDIPKTLFNNMIGAPKYMSVHSPALYQVIEGKLIEVIDFRPFVNWKENKIRDLDKVEEEISIAFPSSD